MDGEYKSLTGKSLESNILFIGQYNCPPNYFFRGNNVRDNYVIHYIQDGCGSFSSANHPAVTLKKRGYFYSSKRRPLLLPGRWSGSVEILLDRFFWYQDKNNACWLGIE